MRTLLVGLLAFSLAALGHVASARADALEPPPTDCPEGSAGQTTRRGGYCAWTPCTGACPSDTDGPALVCSGSEVALCVQTIEYPAAEVQQGPALRTLPAETRQVVLGPCGAGGACGSGQRCERARVCVPPGSSAARGGLCAARAAARRGAPGWALAALVGLVALARARRR